MISPAPGAINQPLATELTWSAGPWAHKYDLFVGTDLSNLTKVLDDRELGPYQRSWTMPALTPGTVYYWRVVSRTMAGLWRSTMTCSFKTTGAGGGTPMSGCLVGPTPPPDPLPIPEPQDVNLPPTTGGGSGGGSTPGPTNGGGSSVVGLPAVRTPSADGTFTGQRAVPRP
jgi:hypothetical protein